MVSDLTTNKQYLSYRLSQISCQIQEQEQLKAMKDYLEEQVEHHQKEIEHHEEAIRRHREAMKKHKKGIDNLDEDSD